MDCPDWQKHIEALNFLGLKLKRHGQSARIEDHDARPFAEIHCADAKSRCKLAFDGPGERLVDAVPLDVATAAQKLSHRIESR